MAVAAALRDRIARRAAARTGSAGTIPIATVSGVASTTPGMIEWFDRETSVTIITTKSIQLRPNPGNREPIITEPRPGCYGNAVGLRNPGVEESVAALAALRRRHELRALLAVSVSGATVEDFVALARRCAPVADILELNYSCPHASAGYGADIGRDEAAIAAITAAVVREVVPMPVLVKLTPNVPDIARMAGIAVTAGAAGVTAVNTVGPATYLHPATGRAVLTNPPDGRGGMSGRWIQERARAAVQAIRTALGPTPLIVGMGGVSDSDGAGGLVAAGADVVGIGSALAGVHQRDWASFLAGIGAAGACISDRVAKHAATLCDTEISGGAERRAPSSHAPKEIYPSICNNFPYTALGMSLVPQEVRRRRELGDGLFELDIAPVASDRDTAGATPSAIPPPGPGQSVFLWIPGVGEKPLAPALVDAGTQTFLIRRRGPFTEAAGALSPGDQVALRGPYGDRWEPPVGGAGPMLLVGAGSGIATLPPVAAAIARRGGTVITTIALREPVAEGAVTAALRERGLVRIVPDAARPGRLLDHLATIATENGCAAAWICGPEPFMAAAAAALEGSGIPSERRFLSLERSMRCGVGMCGECHHGGRLTCQYGTVVTWRGMHEEVTE